MDECEWGFRLARISLEALSVILREFVCVSVKRAESESEVAHAGAYNPISVG